MIDLAKLKKDYDSKKTDGEFITLQQGDTLLYLHGQCRPEDKWEPTAGLNYVELGVHYNVGKAKWAVSWDKYANPIIMHPYVKEVLEKRKIEAPKVCPIAEFINSGSMSPEDAGKARRQQKFLFAATPLMHRTNKSAEWIKLQPKPSIALWPRQIYDGIMDVFCDTGVDITDPNAAVLLIISKTGKGQFDTKYKVSALLEKRPGSVYQPLEIKGKLRALIEKSMQPGESCDLFAVTANMLKSEEQLAELITGVKIVKEDAKVQNTSFDYDEPGDFDEQEEENDVIVDDDDSNTVDDDEFEDDDLGFGALDAEIDNIDKGRR